MTEVIGSMRLLPAAVLLAILSAGPAAAAIPISYVYARDGQARVIPTGAFSLDALQTLIDRWQGEYLWARVEGREYLIRDGATLLSVARVFAPIEELTPRHQELARQIRPLETRAERIKQQIDELTAVGEPEVDVRLRELQRELRSLQSEIRRVLSEEEQLDKKQDELQKEAERRLQEIVGRAIERGLARRV